MNGEGTSQRKSRSLLVAFVIVTTLVMSTSIFAASLYLSRGPSATRTATKTATVTGTLVTATTISSSLELLLMLNATQLVAGHGVNVTAEVRNSSPNFVNVSDTFVWAIPSLIDWGTNLGHCPSFLSIQFYTGHYAISNMSAATPLQTGNPARLVACGGGLAGDGGFFRFEPSSDKAYFFQSQRSSYNGLGYPMTMQVDTNGYYPSNQSQNFVQFSPGSYTVVAGDEWGRMTIAYFSVTAN